MVQRGFKAKCEKLATKYRAELNLEETAPLCSWTFAKHLGVLVWNIEQIPNLPLETLQHLTKIDGSSWSAATICVGDMDLIILNSSHNKGRTSFSLMHELSHIICGHQPARIDPLINGSMILQNYDKDQEDEADILAGTLLLPRVALAKAIKVETSVPAITKKYVVSKELAQWRINMTGVKKQHMYRKKKKSA